MHDLVEDSEAVRHEFGKPNSAHHSGDETSLRSSDPRTTMSTSRRQTLGGRCLRGVAAALEHCLAEDWRETEEGSDPLVRVDAGWRQSGRRCAPP